MIYKLKQKDEKTAAVQKEIRVEEKIYSKKIVLANPIRALIKIDKHPTPNLELIFLGQVHKAKGILELIKSIL